MRHLKRISSSLALLIACAGHAQSTNHTSWLGVWQGELEGQPAVTLTLAEDNGELGGTVVLNMVSREGGTPHVIGSTVHMVTHPSIEGNTLSFDVKRPSDAKLLKMAVVLEANGKMEIECVSCGDDHATTELMKTRP
jgi:hypothetical protein